MKTFIACLCMLFLSLPVRAANLSEFNWLWPHSNTTYDLTFDAVMKGGPHFLEWRKSFSKAYRAMVEENAISAPNPPVVGAPILKKGYALREIGFQFPSGPLIGSLLAVPTIIDPSKPVVVAIHGHEMPERGTTPWSMFDEGAWAERLVQEGYVVWAPSHLWYSQLKVFTEQGHSYHLTWVRMLDRILTAAEPQFPSHRGLAVAGLSSGGVSASFLMAYRQDIDRGIFAGSLIGLTYLRENYRIAGHPNNFDVKSLPDYAPIYALIAPRSAQWQFGRTDSFFPGTAPIPPVSTYFPGTPRPVSVQDFMGEWLLIERVWMLGEGRADLHIHDGGHVFDVSAALEFLAEEGRSTEGQ